MKPKKSIQKALKQGFIHFIKDESGQSTTEYILILAVVVAIATKFRTAILGQLTGLLNSIQGQISDFTSNSGSN